MTPALRDSALLKAARGEAVPHTPVWFMRQAGRSLPEYLAIREGITMLEVPADAEGIEVGRPFPPLLDWARVTIGLPEEMAACHRAMRKVLALDPKNAQAMKIMDAYKEHPQCVNENKLLPVMSNQKMNEYLKGLQTDARLTRI